VHNVRRYGSVALCHGGTRFEPEICQGAGLYCGQIRESGFKSHYEFVLGAGAKAKTVTTCPLFSVLYTVHFTELSREQGIIFR
jgi:hypothetical protein